jgi:fused signal recognition particle receptor
MRANMRKTREALQAEVQATLFEGDLDEETWERLEEALIYADVGVRATAELIRRLEARQDLSELSSALAEEIAALFGEPATLDVAHEPAVILVVGVNGTGKTTTIGKLAKKLSEHGHAVTLGAADTFRAAAEEQLEIWAERSGARFVGGERGGDPASVAYDAVGTDDGVVLVDTAGRLHTQTNLMDELSKVRRVIALVARARRTRCCSSSMRRPARTGCSRRGSSTRRSVSPVSH